MKSGEARIAEAITALTALLEREGVDGAARKAHDFVTELLHQGWRATAPAAYQPDVEHRADPETKQAYLDELRAVTAASPLRTREDT